MKAMAALMGGLTGQSVDIPKAEISCGGLGGGAIGGIAAGAAISVAAGIASGAAVATALGADTPRARVSLPE